MPTWKRFDAIYKIREKQKKKLLNNNHDDDDDGISHGDKIENGVSFFLRQFISDFFLFMPNHHLENATKISNDDDDFVFVCHNKRKK